MDEILRGSDLNKVQAWPRKALADLEAVEQILRPWFLRAS